MKQYEIKVKPVPSIVVSPSTARLTEAEKAVVERLVQGLRNKEIGQQLNIGERTVKFHIGQVLLKTGLHDRHEVAAWWKNDYVDGVERWHLLNDEMKDYLRLYGAGCRYSQIATVKGVSLTFVRQMMLAVRLTLQLKDARQVLLYAVSRGQVADVRPSEIDDKVVGMKHVGRQAVS